MKLLYIANLRLPTEKAYGIQITKMCEAFAECDANVVNEHADGANKINVELVVPYRKNEIKNEFFDYYGVKRNFKFKKIRTPDFYLPGKFDRISVAIKDFISGIILAVYGLFSGADFIYSRDEWPLYFLSFFHPTLTRKRSIAYEAHRFSAGRNFFYRRFKSKNFKIIVITNRLKGDFINLGFKHENILIAPDGVDLAEFDINISREEARTRVGLPLDRKIAMYTGHLFDWKGADLLLEAAKLMLSAKRLAPSVLFVFVGGTDYDVRKFREKARGLENVLILGHKLHKEIPYYLKAADVLVLPNSAKEEISRSYTSPLKLFEYMASKRPIIASNLPSIREILNENNSLLVESDNDPQLTEAIKKIINDPAMLNQLTQKAFEDVKNYTWMERANKILDFIG